MSFGIYQQTGGSMMKETARQLTGEIKEFDFEFENELPQFLKIEGAGFSL